METQRFETETLQKDLDQIARKGLGENMRDALSFIYYIRNGCPTQDTRIVRLAA
jgi:hypothetical protein